MTPSEILRAGLDDQNPGLVQLLGLCPLLAVSTTLGSSLGLGLATLAVLVTSNVAISLVARRVPSEVRIATYVLVIAALVTSLELTIAAWLPQLQAKLGIFLPLIVTNCLLFARAETFASKQPARLAALDGFAMGSGFLLVLLTLGAIRELVGHGSLGSDIGTLFALPAAGTGLRVYGEQHGWLLMTLPPGAFILLGLLLAARQARRGAIAATLPGPTADRTGAPA